MNTTVSFEIAKLLKKKKFDLPCRLLYKSGEELEEGIGEDYNWNRFDCWSAPTIAEVVMWLYEKLDVWIDVSLNQFSKPTDLQWMYSIVFTGDCTYSYSPKSFDTPTEAYSSAIEYTLKNLI